MKSEFKDIEDIIMSHSQRGMPILRDHLPSKYCQESAEYILSWKKGVIFITTGFYVAGHAETDGPPGALILCLILKKLGYIPMILTDKYCQDFFEKYDIKVIYMDINMEKGNKMEFIEKTIKEYNPSGMISIERCGLNIENKSLEIGNIVYQALLDANFDVDWDKTVNSPIEIINFKWDKKFDENMEYEVEGAYELFVGEKNEK